MALAAAGPEAVTSPGAGAVPIIAPVRCAFCRGRGLDPFGLLSLLAACQVCLGRGRVLVPSPYGTCACCAGTGVQPHRRLACSACRGRGVHAQPAGSRPCPVCHGQGTAPCSELDLPCLTCGGRGTIAA